MSAKIPRVFFSALLKSKYLAMYFSSWHPTASPPNYCGVSISLTDANQVCSKPALPSRQAPTPGLAQQSGIVDDTGPLWAFWGWCSPFQNLRSYRRMISLTWNLQDVMLGYSWCCLLALASAKLNLLFVQGNHVLLFMPSLSPLSIFLTTLEFFITQTFPSYQVFSFNLLCFLFPATAEKLSGSVCPAG